MRRKEHTVFFFNEEVDQALRECDDKRAKDLSGCKEDDCQADRDAYCDVCVDGDHYKSPDATRRMEDR